MRLVELVSAFGPGRAPAGAATITEELVKLHVVCAREREFSLAAVEGGRMFDDECAQSLMWHARFARMHTSWSK